MNLNKGRCLARLIGPVEIDTYAPRCRNTRKTGDRFCEFHSARSNRGNRLDDEADDLMQKSQAVMMDAAKLLNRN